MKLPVLQTITLLGHIIEVITTRHKSDALRAKNIIEKWVDNTSVLRAPRVGSLEVKMMCFWSLNPLTVF